MSSSQQDSVLINLLRDRRWDEADSRVKTEEGREDMRRKGEYGWLPLHVACRFGAPFELAETILQGYPEAVRRTDNYESSLPLHCAFDSYRYVVSPPVVRLLLDAHPEGAKVADDGGYLPLHNAASHRASLEVLTMLIDANPEGATTRSHYGELPLHYLARRASPDDKEDVEKVELLLRPLLDDEDACLVSDPSYESGEMPLDIGARFDLLRLHECMRMPRCPAEVIVKVAQRHPEQLREMGEDGSLPLHLAAANPNLNGVLDGQESPIVMLVRLYPDAAAASDGGGRCPLNLAIESGKWWKEGIEAIADAAKGVRTIRDVGTNLFPFMLAASRADACVTTVYELLRCCPDICKKP